MYWIGIGTEVAVLNSQVVPVSQVVLKTGFTVLWISCHTTYRLIASEVLLWININIRIFREKNYVNVHHKGLKRNSVKRPAWVMRLLWWTRYKGIKATKICTHKSCPYIIYNELGGGGGRHNSSCLQTSVVFVLSVVVVSHTRRKQAILLVSTFHLIRARGSETNLGIYVKSASCEAYYYNLISSAVRDCTTELLSGVINVLGICQNKN